MKLRVRPSQAYYIKESDEYGSPYALWNALMGWYIQDNINPRILEVAEQVEIDVFEHMELEHNVKIKQQYRLEIDNMKGTADGVSIDRLKMYEVKSVANIDNVTPKKMKKYETQMALYAYMMIESVKMITTIPVDFYLIMYNTGGFFKKYDFEADNLTIKKYSFKSLAQKGEKIFENCQAWLKKSKDNPPHANFFLDIDKKVFKQLQKKDVKKENAQMTTEQFEIVDSILYINQEMKKATDRVKHLQNAKDKALETLGLHVSDNAVYSSDTHTIEQIGTYRFNIDKNIVEQIKTKKDIFKISTDTKISIKEIK